MQESDKVPQPPQPPQIGREFRMRPVQVVGVSILALIVAFALAGAFGASRGQTSAAAETLELRVTYPTRFRYKTIGTIDVEITNAGGDPLDRVTVRFSRPYIDDFSTVKFTPSASTVTDEAYEVELRDVPSGATRVVSVDVQAEAYWRNAGFVRAETGNAAVEADLRTFVFP